MLSTADSMVSDKISFALQPLTKNIGTVEKALNICISAYSKLFRCFKESVNSYALA